MSDSSNSFSHITVNPAEEDDFVINAGVAKPEERMVEVPSSPADKAKGPAVEMPANQGAASPEGNAAPTGQQPTETKRAKPAGKKARGKAADDYHETTLEDLDSGPMSLTQKIVIVAAILCLIGAVAYYFLFMR